MKKKEKKEEPILLSHSFSTTFSLIEKLVINSNN